MPEPIYHSFEEYWENKGARIYAETHEERARLAWEAARNIGLKEAGPLCLKLYLDTAPPRAATTTVWQQVEL